MSAAILPVLLGLGGKAISAFGQAEAGRTEQDAFNLRAQAIERKGGQEEEISRARIKKLLGRQRALYAKAGVDISTGSPLTILAATAAEGEKEALNIRTETEEGAALERFSGKQARRAGRIGATSTLLTGLGSAASSSDFFKKKGK